VRIERRRADLLLLEQGLCASRAEAQRLLLAGKVRAAGQRVDKPGALLPADAALEVSGSDHPFVSRGGVKCGFAHGLQVGSATVLPERRRFCRDSDCLLRGPPVIAVDVGYGQLHPRLRQDIRVQVLERTNVRHLEASRLPAIPDLATIDASFISLVLVLPPVCRLLGRPFEMVALVKPQFEVGKGEVGKRGVVRESALHRAVLERVAACAAALGCGVRGIAASPLLGPMGNREFLMHLTSDTGGDVAALVTQVMAGATD
jgi:23S rRNA (cytidine1920-2'-O)/16S rRNA (cytidine1409-2'-O)-methyltransferase